MKMKPTQQELKKRMDGVIEDITKRKRMQKAFGRRDIILKTIHLAAERFFCGPFGKRDIQNILEKLGWATNAGRVYIFKNHMDEGENLLTSQRYEWVAPGIEPQSVNPILQGLAFATAGFERWQHTLGHGQAIYGHVREFPQSEQALLAGQHIVSMAVAPIFVGSQWWGFIGFDACQAERKWSTVEIDALKTAANIFGAAILHRRSAKALQDSEQRYRALSDATFESVFISEKGVCLDANHRTKEMFGYDYDELIGMFGSDVIAPESKALVSHRMLSGYEKPYEAVAQRKDGSTFYAEIRGKMTTYNGKAVRVTVVRDIDERKRYEDALKESQERFQTLTEYAPFGLSIMKANRRFEYFNPKFTAIFGYTLDDLPDKDTWFEKAYPDPKYRDRVRTIWSKDFICEVNPREVASRIFKARCKDGQNKIIRFRNVALTGGKQLLSYEDITSQAEAEKMLKRSENKLHFLTSRLLTTQENERRRMSMELHDDLGQRLALLKLQIHAVAKSLPTDQVKLVADCDHILNYVAQTIEYVRRISHDLSPSGIHDLGLSVALKHLFKDYTDHFDVRIVVDMPDIDTQFSPDTEVIIYRIFQEAMTNITRHAQAKTISVAIRKQKESISFLVEDDGVGFSVEKVTATDPVDKGLGLVAMDERIRMVEGQLEISSRINSGTRIAFTVPTL